MDKYPPRAGEVVLRPVNLLPEPGKGTLTYGKEPALVSFDKSEANEPMIYARRDVNMDNLWVITDSGKGMVIFVENEVPDDFTHLVITKVGQSSRSVHAKACMWNTQTLLDLFSTPQEESNAHAALVNRVMDVLKRKPELLPAQTLARGMSEEDINMLIGHWVHINRPEAPREYRDKVLAAVRVALGSLVDSA